MARKTKSKKRKLTSRRRTKRKGVQIGSPEVFNLYGGL